MIALRIHMFNSVEITVRRPCPRDASGQRATRITSVNCTFRNVIKQAGSKARTCENRRFDHHLC